MTFFLTKANKLFFKGKTVLLRIDADVDLVEKDRKLVVDEDFRLKSAVQTIHFLKNSGVKRIVILSHLDKPAGKIVSKFSLQPIVDWFSRNVEKCELLTMEQVEKETKVQDAKIGKRQYAVDNLEKYGSLIVLENLRFDKGEEANSVVFAKKLASFGDIFVNDAFGVSHRLHSSIVNIPKYLPSFLGLHFETEMKILSLIKVDSKRPIIFVLGGSKEDKLDYLKFLGNWADKVLVGGKLPKLRGKREVGRGKSNILFGSLTKNGKDIDGDTIKNFKKIIQQAATIIWAGPMGVYEETENQRGTFAIAELIVKSSAFKACGGGDTHRVLSNLRIWDEFDFVSTGGGAMLAFLRNGTLPGVEAVKSAAK